MKKIIALSLAMLMFVMPVNAGWYADWDANHRKKETQCLWAILQRQIVEIDKQVKIQNQAADKLDEHSDDLEANKEYKIETIKYWEKRKNAAMTAIRYNELVGDKDNLEREKGYLSEAKRNIELLANENSELKVSFSSKVSNGFHAVTSFISRHKVALLGIAGVCIVIVAQLTVFKYLQAHRVHAASGEGALRGDGEIFQQREMWMDMPEGLDMDNLDGLDAL